MTKDLTHLREMADEGEDHQKRMQTLEDTLDKRLMEIGFITEEVYYYPEKDEVCIEVFSLSSSEYKIGTGVYSLKCSLDDVSQELVDKVVFSVIFL
jgi:hypothetical protein